MVRLHSGEGELLAEGGRGHGGVGRGGDANLGQRARHGVSKDEAVGFPLQRGDPAQPLLPGEGMYGDLPRWDGRAVQDEGGVLDRGVRDEGLADLVAEERGGQPDGVLHVVHVMVERQHEQGIAAEMVEFRKAHLVLTRQVVERHVLGAVGVHAADMHRHRVGEPGGAGLDEAIFQGFRGCHVAQVRRLEQGDLRRAERAGVLRRRAVRARCRRQEGERDCHRAGIG